MRMSFNCLNDRTKPGMECATGISKETWVHRDEEKTFWNVPEKKRYKIVRGVQLWKENRRGDNMPVRQLSLLSRQLRKLNPNSLQ